MAEKQINVMHGFFIGIRILKENEINNCIPPMFSLYKKYKKKENTVMWVAKEML
ncbi:MAG: hypothetical protein IPJ81_19285 [Chitinophagaceae bacterium]|nr:hypothetical protein [Chitinophagaceae bacterium]